MEGYSETDAPTPSSMQTQAPMSREAFTVFVAKELFEKGEKPYVVNDRTGAVELIHGVDDYWQEEYADMVGKRGEGPEATDARLLKTDFLEYYLELLVWWGEVAKVYGELVKGDMANE